LILRDQRLRRALDTFWLRWKKDYIADRLRFRAPGRLTVPPRINQFVLVHDANAKRIKWQTAIITDLTKGKDGHTRLAFLRTRTGAIMNRPVQNLYPLELDERVEDPQHDKLAILPPPGTTKLPVPAKRKLQVFDIQHWFTAPDAVSVPPDSAVPTPPIGAVSVPVTPIIPVAAPAVAVARPAQCVGTSQQKKKQTKQQRAPPQQEPAALRVTTGRRGRTIRPTWKQRDAEGGNG